MKARIFLLLGPLLLSACGEASGGSGATTQNAYALIAYLEGVQPPLEQCSRDTVAAGDRYFLPYKPQVDALETALKDRLVSLKRHDGSTYFEYLKTMAGGSSMVFPTSWRRSYMGIERKGARFIYADFALPLPDEGTTGSRHTGEWGEVVCDGGPAFFGAEYEIATGKIKLLGFNEPPAFLY